MTLVPIDRATIALVWSDDGYPADGAYRDYHRHTVHHHNPWGNDGEAYDHARARRARRGARRGLRGPHAASACAATALACPEAGWRCARWTPSCSATGGTRGSPGWRRSSRSARGRGSSWCAWTTRSSGSSRRRCELAARLAERGGVGGEQLGQGRRPVDLVGAARSPSWRSRRARPSSRCVAAGAAAGAAAVRELLALQASDWAFMVSREPRRAVRARALRGAPSGARARARSRGRRQRARRLRNLAVHADRSRAARALSSSASAPARRGTHSQRIERGASRMRITPRRARRRRRRWRARPW